MGARAGRDGQRRRARQGKDHARDLHPDRVLRPHPRPREHTPAHHVRRADELRRCARAGDNRSQTGLELEVIDHYNGTARSVKTLSGGETFAASLSLALGLSDEVQATAGGVQLEAMFVDEGFGSLDSEALQQALAALVGVSGGNRIVGIISHVAELKDRIDRQIIVTKDRSGGSRVQVQA